MGYPWVREPPPSCSGRMGWRLAAPIPNACMEGGPWVRDPPQGPGPPPTAHEIHRTTAMIKGPVLHHVHRGHTVDLLTGRLQQGMSHYVYIGATLSTS